MPVPHFSIILPTKPYLKKYMEALYGSPIKFNADTYFGKVIAACLDKNVYPDKNRSFIWKAFDEYNDELKIFLPIDWLKKYFYGTDLTDKKAVFVNKLIQDKFEEDLYMFCTILDLAGVDRKESIEEFCTRYKIEIDTHITFEALKKMEYRFRSKKELEYNLPEKIKNSLQMTFF